MHIVSVIVISFFVGFGCFQWGKSKAADEQYRKEQQYKDEQNKQKLQEKERENQQYEILTKENEKELMSIKSVAKDHNIKLSNIQMKGIQYMIKEKFNCFPNDPDEIYKFIKHNILDIKKGQE